MQKKYNRLKKLKIKIIRQRKEKKKTERERKKENFIELQKPKIEPEVYNNNKICD